MQIYGIFEEARACDVISRVNKREGEGTCVFFLSAGGEGEVGVSAHEYIPLGNMMEPFQRGARSSSATGGCNLRVAGFF